MTEALAGSTDTETEAGGGVVPPPPPDDGGGVFEVPPPPQAMVKVVSETDRTARARDQILIFMLLGEGRNKDVTYGQQVAAEMAYKVFAVCILTKDIEKAA